MGKPRSTQKSTNGRSQQNSQKKSGQGSGSTNRNKKYSEFKFQPHDALKKNGYTFEKIQEAAILKLQTTLVNGRYVVKSLRDRVKKGPPEPVLQTSTKGADDSDPLRIKEQKQFDMNHSSKFDYWCQQNNEFEENWEKAYGIIFSQYCSNTMQLAMKEHPDFESRIRDDPMELLIEVEKAMHVPMKSAYPVLTLIDTLCSFMTIKQGDKEGILSYLERFKAERNVFLSLFGDTILDQLCQKY